MRLNKKRGWQVIAVVALLMVAAIGGVWWSAAHQPPPQIITLPNGEQYRFAGVTISTKMIPPTPAAQILSRLLPTRLENPVRNHLGIRVVPYTTAVKYDSPQLFVWFERLGTNSSPARVLTSLRAFLANESGAEGGVERYLSFGSGLSPWSFCGFPVAPKRGAVVRCNLYTTGAPTNLVAQITFPNPYRGRFPQWNPEVLPAVKQAGDFDVSLDTFSIGRGVVGRNVLGPDGFDVPLYVPLNSTAKEGESSRTWLDFSIRSAKGTNEAWVLRSAELTDATGNLLSGHADNTENMLANDPKYAFSDGWKACKESLDGVLWRDEHASRLKLEFKRLRGFDRSELVTFKQVPVPKAGSTNSLFLTNTLGGIQIMLGWPESRVHLETVAPRSGVTAGLLLSRFYMSIASGSVPRELLRAELLGQPPGLTLDFVQMSIDGQPAEIAIPGEPSYDAGDWVRLASIPTNAQTADITFVVQKTRTVEFLVKPPAAGQIK